MKEHFSGWNALVAIAALVGVGHQSMMIKSLEKSLLSSNQGVHSSLQGDIRRLQENNNLMRAELQALRVDISSSASSYKKVEKKANGADVDETTLGTKGKRASGAGYDEFSLYDHGSGGRKLQEDAGYDSTSVSSMQVRTPVLCAASVETWALSINGTNLVNYMSIEFDDIKRMLYLIVGSLTKSPTSPPTPLPTLRPSSLPTPQPTISPRTCRELLDQNPLSTSGVYSLNVIEGSKRSVYCDMTTNGGGWTVVFAQQLGDNTCGKPRLIDDAERAGNPLSFEAYNVNRATKAALSAMSTESIFIRSTGTWMKASHTLFDSSMYAGSTANVDFGGVTLTASDGTTVTGKYMAYAQSKSSSGGSYGVGDYIDHHSASYWDLNSGCREMYLYEYGDSGGSYKVNKALGSWTATDACSASCDSSLGFLAAMR